MPAEGVARLTHDAELLAGNDVLAIADQVSVAVQQTDIHALDGHVYAVAIVPVPRYQ
jgi:hypothetical protein